VAGVCAAGEAGAGAGVGLATGALGCATGGVTGAIVGSGSGWARRLPGSEKSLISAGPTTVFVSCAWKAAAGEASRAAPKAAAPKR
jgi:hypothetical protein